MFGEKSRVPRRRTRSHTPRREFRTPDALNVTSDLIVSNSPKIQRLITPVRLQRRRHLRSLKRRRIERQKEQKSEYDALLAKRIAEKKEKAAAVKASHKK